MGPIHNAGTGDCNDSIKPRSSVSAPGWCIDWALVRVREGQVAGSAKCACRHTHTHIYTHNPLPLIYFRSVLMSSWPRPQLLSADDLAPVLMKKPGNSTEDTHRHTTRSCSVAADISTRSNTREKDVRTHKPSRFSIN